ncbi:MAG: hypothetical protein K0Q60_4767 [Microvirga sp.]|nr:hypothetical protein [Microvirga sp.]
MTRYFGKTASFKQARRCGKHLTRRSREQRRRIEARDTEAGDVAGERGARSLFGSIHAATSSFIRGVKPSAGLADRALRCDASAPAAELGPSVGSAAAVEATGWSRWNGHCSTLRLQLLETTYLFSPHPAGGRIERPRVELGPSSGVGSQQSVDLGRGGAGDPRRVVGPPSRTTPGLDEKQQRQNRCRRDLGGDRCGGHAIPPPAGYSAGDVAGEHRNDLPARDGGLQPRRLRRSGCQL